MSRYAELILELINQSQGHMTAEQIFLELKTEPRIVQATVYNNLNALCQEGLIRKLSLEGSLTATTRFCGMTISYAENAERCPMRILGI